MLLFRRDMEPRCAYCAKGTVINDREVACARKGVVAGEYHCRRGPGGPRSCVSKKEAEGLALQGQNPPPVRAYRVHAVSLTLL